MSAQTLMWAIVRDSRVVCEWQWATSHIIPPAHTLGDSITNQFIEMKFEHLVVINDPLNPLIEPLMPTQLWRGLVLRARAPKLFVPWLDDCDIIVNAPDRLKRVLRYGDVTIRDQVQFEPEQLVKYDIPAQNDIPASTLTMHIEAPGADALTVRFSYEDDVDEVAGSMDAFYNEFRRSAYQEADIDTVRIIRELAADGRFDSAES